MDPQTLLNEDFFNELEFDALPEEQAGLPEEYLPKSLKYWRPPTNQPHQTSPWDPRLILDLALSIESTEQILERYAVSEQEYDAFLKMPAFRRDLALTMKEVRENGLSFKHKARVQAESYLEVLDQLVYSESTPSGVRLDGIKQAVTWANLIPKDEKGEAQSQSQINIQINF